LLSHSTSVKEKALEIASIHPEMNLDKKFISEAAMLHDIGICQTYALEIDCLGDFPYICHGYLGADMLRKENLDKHALVSERHTGSGITKKEIQERQLPIPCRDMLPISNEEKIICLADKFFSKTKLDKEKSIDEIRKGLAKYGKDSLARFDELVTMFLS
jgi:uncharacterized domain HDIG